MIGAHQVSLQRYYRGGLRREWPDLEVRWGCATKAAEGVRLSNNRVRLQTGRESPRAITEIQDVMNMNLTSIQLVDRIHDWGMPQVQPEAVSRFLRVQAVTVSLLVPRSRFGSSCPNTARSLCGDPIKRLLSARRGWHTRFCDTLWHPLLSLQPAATSWYWLWRAGLRICTWRVWSVLRSSHLSTCPLRIIYVIDMQTCQYMLKLTSK